MFCRFLACAGIAVLVSSGHAARADDECTLERNGVGLGFVISSRGCRHTVNIDVTVQAVTANWHDFGPRLTLESSYLRSVEGLPSLHIGPMFAIGGTDLFASKSALSSVDLSTGFRSRYWLGEENPWFFFDTAMGPLFTFPTHGAPPRAGGFLEIGANVRGLFGTFLIAEPTVSTADHKLGWRYGLGAKTNITGFAVLLLVYACAQGGCSGL